MPLFHRPKPAATFWRCMRCGTPNPWAAYLTHCVGCGTPRPSRSEVIREQAGQPARSAKARFSSLPPPSARWIVAASWVYAAIVLVMLLLIRGLGDRWWLATVLLFMPRMVLLLPVVLLAALAGWARRPRLWALHGAILLVVLFPILGLSLPIGQLWSFRMLGPRLRIMTLNQGIGSTSGYRLISLIESLHISLVCFQEGYTGHEGSPDEVLETYFAKGWHHNRERSIFSRLPIAEELPPLDNPDGDATFWRARVDRVRLKTPEGAEFVLAAVHMPSMSYALEGLLAFDVPTLQNHIAWRAGKMGLAAAHLADSPDLPMLVGGDFNMPADSTLMSSLAAAHLHYAFDQAGWGFGYTRPSGFPWVRIDHILGSPEWTFTRCWVGPDVGSDHLPLIAEAILKPTGAGPAAAAAGSGQRSSSATEKPLSTRDK